MSTAALPRLRTRKPAPPRQPSAFGSIYSEKDKLAVLQADHFRESPRLTANFAQPECRLELLADSVLLSGHWSAELVVDGQRLAPRGEWEEVCWHEDEDVVYLELETELAPGWCLQRHILLARQESFVLLADAVLGEREAKISFSSQIPLGEAVQFRPESETHEGWLVSGKQLRVVLPLGLPEWRADRPVGSLAAADGRLALTTSTGRRRNLFQAILIPLGNARRKLEYTWRPLTVAEELEIQPPDAAAAYRAQVGDRQWVVYRALTRGNRTFLGKNLTSELFVGVFHRSGQMDAIMEVE